MLAERFRRFAAGECHGYSPLYERLALGVADDAALVELAGHSRSGQPAPNLLLGAVHLLLLGGTGDELGAFYPDLAGAKLRQDDPLPALRAFCHAHAEAIREILETRRVQVNEVGRSAVLLPAFAAVAARAGGRPLALLEIGASAGLNLLFDRYAYHYPGAGSWGDPSSPVQLRCEVPGRPPDLPADPPAIAARVGIDLNPLSPGDPADALWLRALVWPEHAARAERLEAALELARRDPPRVIAGDALDLLPEVAASSPGEAALCVFHTSAACQLSPEGRERLAFLLAGIGRERDLFHLSGEGSGTSAMLLELSIHAGGSRDEIALARYQAHGAWIEWLG